MPDARRPFSPTASSVAEARAFAAAALAEWGAGEHEWPVLSVVSELATNAVLHARTDYQLSLSFDGEAVRVSVLDGSPARPAAREAGPEATTGRGLLLVSRLAREWGVSPNNGATGKSVWAVVDGSSPLSQSEDPESLLSGWDDDGEDGDRHLLATG